VSAEHTHDAGAGHETTDVTNPTLWIFATGIILLSAVAFIVVSWIWRELAAKERRQVAPTPMARLRTPPPPPRLQVNPPADLAHIRGDEEKLLEGFAWIDKQNGIVRIPIERAMDILAERGLPLTKPQPPPRRAP
jgi:hypothetical protein